MDKIVGVVFPVPQRWVNRLLIEDRNVFVKYVSGVKDIQGIKIAPKHRVLFYVSHGALNQYPE